MKKYPKSSRRQIQPRLSRQRGASLVTTVLILLIVTFMAFAASRLSLNQVQTASRAQFQQIALDRAEAAVALAEQWLLQPNAKNWNSLSFETYSSATPHLYPTGGLTAQGLKPISMNWSDANSFNAGNSSRYIIEKIGENLAGGVGGSLAIGSKSTSACSTVSLFNIYGLGESAKESRRVVRTVYSVPNC